MRVSLLSLGTGTETAIAIVTATATVTVDSTDGMEGLKRTGRSLEETVSEWASRAEMTEEVLGTWQLLCASSWCVRSVITWSKTKYFVIIRY
jgi:hypothetical protein